MTRTLASASIAVAVLAMMLMSTRDTGESVRAQSGERASSSWPRAAETPAPPIVTRVVSRAFAESRRPGPPAPHRGVRGVVTSTRVKLADGSDGVDVRGWEATVYALVPSAERHAVDRIGILKRRAPSSPRGDFEIDLPTGRHLVLLEHRAGEGAAQVLEVWYAYAEILESQSTPVDFGRHAFATAAIAGVLKNEDGRACAQTTVELSDEIRMPGDPLTRGVCLLASTSEDGRFAFSIARADRIEPVGRLSARVGAAEASREGVRGGEFVELVLVGAEPEADVTFELEWLPGMIFWVWSEDRRIAFKREGGRAGPGGVLEERRRLPLGRYVVEVLRREDSGDAWWRGDVVVAGKETRRVRIDPRFGRARAVTGRAPPGTTISWVTRIADGSTFVRDAVAADPDGRFVLRGVPTTELFVRTGSALTRVPGGDAAVLDIGELAH